MSTISINLAEVLHCCDDIAGLIQQGQQGAADEARREAGPLFSEYFAVPENLAYANANSAMRFERNTVNLIDVHHAGTVFAIRV